MTSKSVALLLADLGVIKTHSRPHVSYDNPCSEAHFKTLKYQPDFPGSFGCLVDARAWAKRFFDWYNTEHHHTGIGLLTPADVHWGRTQVVLQQRQQVLDLAFKKTPERFVKGPRTLTRPNYRLLSGLTRPRQRITRPLPKMLPKTTWIIRVIY